MSESISAELLSILACPVCKGDIELVGGKLKCSLCNAIFPIKDGVPIMMPHNLEKEQKLALLTWGKDYEKLNQEIKSNGELNYIDQYGLSDHELVTRFARKSDKNFLELGCGRARLSFLLAKQGMRIVGLDLSIEALLIAKYMFSLHNLPGFFVCGDILHPPFKAGSFSIAFAGGSIEHFKDTEEGLKSIAEMLTKEGIFIATVPFLSISTFLQGLFTRNIPDIPVLRSFLKFIYLDILNKQAALFGYEKSFSITGLSKYFRKANFEKIKMGPYETEYTLKLFKRQWQRNLVIKLIELRLFWPMIYVKGEHI